MASSLFTSPKFSPFPSLFSKSSPFPPPSSLHFRSPPSTSLLKTSIISCFLNSYPSLGPRPDYIPTHIPDPN
ncbi:hypothetical protein SLA2020_093190 [Shorea laevis]